MIQMTHTLTHISSDCDFFQTFIETYFANQMSSFLMQIQSAPNKNYLAYMTIRDIRHQLKKMDFKVC